MQRSLLTLVVMGVLAALMLEFARRGLDQTASVRQEFAVRQEAVEVEVGGRCAQPCRIRRFTEGDVTGLAVELSPFGAFDPQVLARQTVQALERVRPAEEVEPTYRILLEHTDGRAWVFQTSPPFQPRRALKDLTEPVRPVRIPDPVLPASPPGR